MTSRRFIAELGSCHMGKYSRIEEAIDKCSEYGLELKLQLFPKRKPFVPTNIWLDPKIFKKAYKYAAKKNVSLSASVFDPTSFNFLKKLKPQFIKLAYSQKERADLSKGKSWAEQLYKHGIEVIVSCDIMTDKNIMSGATKLYCIPEYPVRYEVNFDGIFPRFDGFSDHTLGFRQTEKALHAGAKIIEKHVKLGYNDETCPDSLFAVNLIELGEFARDNR